MFAVYGGRTMANAKPKFRTGEEEETWVPIEEIRRRKIKELSLKWTEEVTEKRRVAMQEAVRAIAAHRAAQSDRQPYRHTYTEIERRICRARGVTVAEVRSHRRHKEIVFVRHAIAYWAARLTKRSLPEIGRLMGGFDHTTILHGKRKYPVTRAAMGRLLRQVR